MAKLTLLHCSSVRSRTIDLLDYIQCTFRDLRVDVTGANLDPIEFNTLYVETCYRIQGPRLCMYVYAKCVATRRVDQQFKSFQLQ